MIWTFGHLLLSWPAAGVIAGGIDSEDLFTKLAVALALALIVTIASAPYFYRRALSKRGQKNLSAFLMNDEKTRDLIMETGGKERGKSQGEAETGADLDRDPPDS